MLYRHKNNCQFSISNTPGTTGGFVVAAATADHVRPGADEDGAMMTWMIYEAGVGFEVIGAAYVHGTQTVGRGVLESSSAAGNARLNFTAAAIVSNVLGAAKGNEIEQKLDLGYVLVQNDGSTGQTLTGNAGNKIGACLTTVVSDPNGWWDNTNKWLLFKRPGKFFVAGGLQMPGNNLMQVYVTKNGIGIGPAPIYQAAETGGFTFSPIEVNGTTDKVELYAYVASTGSPRASTPFILAYFLGA